MIAFIQSIFLLFLFNFIVTLQCPNEYQPSTVVANKCIHIHIEKQNCINATNYCQLNGGYLTSISSAFENNQIYVFALEQQTFCNYWIGAVDSTENGNYQWIDGQSFNYANWNTDQPNTTYDHVSMLQSNGKWTTEQCTNLNCFICEIYTTTTTNIPLAMTDCYDWRFVNGSTLNGIYQINPGYGLEPFDVYCDMTTDGGGWTVIQRRVDDSLEFYNNTWNDYKVGFNNGIENGNLWLGNDRIHVMSTQSNVILRIEINGEQWPNTNPNLYLYGTYNFSISDEMNNYTLQISLPIEGNASDTNESRGFIYNNGLPFSTRDKDSNAAGNLCANINQYGGWWFDSCTFVALNGKYNTTTAYSGFLWYNLEVGFIHPNRSEMKIRRQ